MPITHFDQLAIGETLTCEPFSFTEEQVIAFCREYDPQYFHVDPIAAKESQFGGLIASGWQTAAMTLNRLIGEHLHLPGAVTGIGLDALRWRGPVYPGDVLRAEATMMEKRLSASKPGWGIARAGIRVLNQQGVCILEMETTVMVRAG